MGRPATKTDLISAANENYEEMNRLIAALTVVTLTARNLFVRLVYVSAIESIG